MASWIPLAAIARLGPALLGTLPELPQTQPGVDRIRTTLIRIQRARKDSTSKFQVPLVVYLTETVAAKQLRDHDDQCIQLESL